jgi:predicted hydrolase (HD superfamily)
MEIKDSVNQLAMAYAKLKEANQKFIADENAAVEAFQHLIDQRRLVIEDIDIIAIEFRKQISHKFREHSFPCGTVPEMIRAVQVLAPDCEKDCNNLKEKLKQLVESDEEVEKKIELLKDSVKKEINKIRRGTKGIRGYKQNQTMGSCFINKIK